MRGAADHLPANSVGQVPHGRGLWRARDTVRTSCGRVRNCSRIPPNPSLMIPSGENAAVTIKFVGRLSPESSTRLRRLPFRSTSAPLHASFRPSPSRAGSLSAIRPRPLRALGLATRRRDRGTDCARAAGPGGSGPCASGLAESPAEPVGEPPPQVQNGRRDSAVLFTRGGLRTSQKGF